VQWLATLDRARERQGVSDFREVTERTGGRAAPARHFFDINDQTHPKRCRSGQDGRLRNADVQRFIWWYSAQAFNDHVTQPALAFHSGLRAPRLVDVAVSADRVRKHRHSHFQSDHHKMLGAIVIAQDLSRMRIRQQGKSGTVSPDPHSNLGSLSFGRSSVMGRPRPPFGSGCKKQFVEAPCRTT